MAEPQPIFVKQSSARRAQCKMAVLLYVSYFKKIPSLK